MKKSGETQIMLDALVAHAGLLPTKHLECAINFGLKKIRRERFEERKGRKAAEEGECLSS